MVGITTDRSVYRRSAKWSVLLMSLLVAGAAHAGQWVGTWATAPERPGLLAAPPTAGAQELLGKTLRQVVNASVGGNKVRVRLSNETGTAPLKIRMARISLQDNMADRQPGTNKRLKFGNKPWVVIPAGEVVWSDPVKFRVPELSQIMVSIFVPAAGNDPTSPVTYNQYGLQTAYTATGNHAMKLLFPMDAATPPQEPVYWLTGVDVYRPGNTPVVAFLGDSLTDGFDAFRVGPKNPFPHELALRIAGGQGDLCGILNLGISGNQVSQSALTLSAQGRFDLDVLVQSGVTHVFIFEGINDIGIPTAFFAAPPTSADVIIAGLDDLVTRAKAAGLKVIGATLTPFNGFDLVANYYTAEGNEVRLAVNEWIRNSGAYDLVVDFDAAVVDPGDATFMRQELRSNVPLDGLHFNAAGYQALANAIPENICEI